MFMYQSIPSKGRPSPRTFDLKTFDLKISVGKKIVDVLYGPWYETTLILCLFFFSDFEYWSFSFLPGFKSREERTLEPWADG